MPARSTTGCAASRQVTTRRTSSAATSTFRRCKRRPENLVLLRVGVYRATCGRRANGDFLLVVSPLIQPPRLARAGCPYGSRRESAALVRLLGEGRERSSCRAEQHFSGQDLRHQS